MTKEEIIAKIATLERELVRLQLMLRDLHLQIREGLEPDERVAPRYRS